VKTKYVYIADSSMKYLVARQQFRFHGNTQRFHIVDTYMSVNNSNRKGAHCVSMVTAVRRTRRIVTLYDLYHFRLIIPLASQPRRFII
jgi:hypothetical protein